MTLPDKTNLTPYQINCLLHCQLNLLTNSKFFSFLLQDNIYNRTLFVLKVYPLCSAFWTFSSISKLYSSFFYRFSLPVAVPAHSPGTEGCPLGVGSALCPGQPGSGWGRPTRPASSCTPGGRAQILACSSNALARPQWQETYFTWREKRWDVIKWLIKWNLIMNDVVTSCSNIFISSIIIWHVLTRWSPLLPSHLQTPDQGRSLSVWVSGLQSSCWFQSPCKYKY